MAFSFNARACNLVEAENKYILMFPPKFDSLSPKHDYIFQLLQLILKKSKPKYGLCEVQLLDQRLPLKRMEKYLKNKHLIDVVALTVNKQRDKKFLPITIPISKGLMGYRLFMIRKGDTEKFANISDLSGLSTFLAGQGIGWADVEILEHNKLPVVTGGSVKTLIDMLAYNRFDYFPRGALQMMAELNNYKDKAVQLETTLALAYPSMTALYVHKSNKHLAERLEFGLKKAIEDGSFDKFFYSHPSSVKALEFINFEQRQIIQICNPILPTWVPIEKKQYWLHPWPDNIRKNKC
ncbi:hypothetical protein [Thalassotalea castellviae]|uniref:Solute-binding protein family 3/N-terminal domain-containing protein n=1 Tax=Thalassotalea castellviae TaxID=3075612 RepID=A0ABU2ZY91_9GAMM|nr:hypothetical protein [Thalassotalea sp. W431]MDT0602525.1 hypothetical protein [Thalassotalea sp. W431]